MCTRFYVEPASYRSLIIRAQKIQLANDIMVKLGKPLAMCGEMRPTDVIAVLAPNKDGKSHEATDAPIVNCRLETASQKEMWKDSWFRRRCVIPCSCYFEWNISKVRTESGQRSETSI